MHPIKLLKQENFSKRHSLNHIELILKNYLGEESKIREEWPESIYKPNNQQIELIWQQSEWSMGRSFHEQTLVNYWYTSTVMERI